MLSNYALRSNLGYSSNQHEAVRGFEPILAQCVMNVMRRHSEFSEVTMEVKFGWNQDSDRY